MASAHSSSVTNGFARVAKTAGDHELHRIAGITLPEERRPAGDLHAARLGRERRAGPGIKRPGESLELRDDLEKRDGPRRACAATGGSVPGRAMRRRDFSESVGRAACQGATPTPAEGARSGASRGQSVTACTTRFFTSCR